MNKFQIDIGKCYKTIISETGEEAVISFSGTCGYVINEDKSTFQMIFIHGNRGEKMMLNDELKMALKRFFI